MIGGAGTAVLVADDATVIGVAGDPLIIVTGGVFVVGGVVVLVGELLSWWD
jgi:predicted tellurium resistance membrane protein TerC